MKSSGQNWIHERNRMSRRKVIAGNWKMYKTATEARALVEELKQRLAETRSASKVVVCPPFTALAVVKPLLEGTEIKLGAQNMHTEQEGAYTGEISAPMLIAAGCEYVILGHSERRQYFGETDAFINTKTKKALASGLTPIACLGETLDQREKGDTNKIVTTQLRGVLANLSAEEAVRCIIAYEPVWAIGTGKTATPEQAQDVHALLRSELSAMFGAKAASEIVIQYGGSVKPENARSLLSQPDIDGALVGGASLKPDSFAAIIAAA